MTRTSQTLAELLLPLPAGDHFRHCPPLSLRPPGVASDYHLTPQSCTNRLTHGRIWRKR